LDGGIVSLELDDLSDEFVPADLDELVHLGTSHLLGHNH
jgi:hypothetical protein